MIVPLSIAFTHSLKTRFAVFLAVLIGVVLIGNWYILQQSQTMLRRESELRGKWLARNLAYHFGYANAIEDRVFGETLLAGIFSEEDIVYVNVLDPMQNVLFSNTRSSQEAVVISAETLRNVTCDVSEPVMQRLSLRNEWVYDVGVRIVGMGDQEKSPRCVGTLHLGVSWQPLHGNELQLRLTTLAFPIFIIVIGAIGYRVFSHVLVSPIVKIAEIGMKIATGDLRQRVQIDSKDEIGVLGTAFSRILDASNTLAMQLQSASEHLKHAADEMLRLAEEQSSVSQDQAASIAHISQAIEEIASSSFHIADAATNVETLADKTFASTMTVQEIVKTTISTMDATKDHVGENTERIVGLSEQMSQITNVVKLINTIADQTKLLAFNASIEAAGAGGVAGERFSVVATEVRRLANTVGESVGEIVSSIAAIQSATRDLVISSETGIQKVNQGATLISNTDDTLQAMMEMLENTTEAVKEISQSTQTQQTKNAMIVKMMKNIASGSERSVDMAAKTTDIAKELRHFSEKLDATIRQLVT